MGNILMSFMVEYKINDDIDEGEGFGAEWERGSEQDGRCKEVWGQRMKRKRMR